MEKQNNHPFPTQEELKAIGIVNLPQFYQTSKQVLTYAIATLAVLNAEYLQGDEDRDNQINHLREIQMFMKVLEGKGKET